MINDAKTDFLVIGTRLIHAFVYSHLDYCNTLLFGFPKYQLDCFYLQKVQNSVLRFVYKSLNNQSPSYIKDLLSLKPAANYALRSSAQSLLFIPKVNCSALEIGPLLILHLCYELAAIDCKNK